MLSPAHFKIPTQTRIQAYTLKFLSSGSPSFLLAIADECIVRSSYVPAHKVRSSTLHDRGSYFEEVKYGAERRYQETKNGFGVRHPLAVPAAQSRPVLESMFAEGYV